MNVANCRRSMGVEARDANEREEEQPEEKPKGGNRRTTFLLKEIPPKCLPSWPCHNKCWLLKDPPCPVSI